MSRVYAIALSALVALLFFGGCLDKMGKTDKPVAVVNGEPISRQELDKELEGRFGKPVLELMVTARMILQEAKKKNLTCAPEEIQKKVDIVLQQPQIAMRIKQNNMSMDDLQRDIKLALLMNKLIISELKDDDKKVFFEQNRKDLVQVKVSHILVKTQAEADKIHKELKAGGDFAAAAKSSTLDTSTKEKGGDLGFITEKAPLVAEFKKAAFALKAGEMSAPVKTQFGWHIIKVTEEKKSFEDLKSTIDEVIALERQQDFLKRLKDSAKVEYSL